jgi:hypothetical protein
VPAPVRVRQHDGLRRAVSVVAGAEQASRAAAGRRASAAARR